MRWTVIARKDYDAVWASRVSKLLIALIALVAIISAYVFPIEGQGRLSTADFAVSVHGDLALVLALAGLLLGYEAIVGERQAGQLRLLLALPHARRGIIVGKLLGRGAFLTLAITASLVVAGALVVYPFGSLALAPYLGFILVTIVVGMLFLGLGITISSALSSERRATAAAFLTFFVFVLIWDDVPNLLAFLLAQAGLHEGPLPNWVMFLHGLEPVSLYSRVVEGLIGGGSFEPWYMNEWVALIVLIGWTVVPVWAGMRRFEGAEI